VKWILILKIERGCTPSSILVQKAVETPNITVLLSVEDILCAFYHLKEFSG
jgi:hypothetical protein